MNFTRYNDEGILVDYHTGLPVDDASVSIEASGKVVSSVSMMDAKLKVPSARDAYIMALGRPPRDADALAKEYRERNVVASLEGIAND